MAKLNTAPIGAPAKPASALLLLRYAIAATSRLAMPPMLQIAQNSANPFQNRAAQARAGLRHPQSRR
jgi:hypothetical protein